MLFPVGSGSCLAVAAATLAAAALFRPFSRRPQAAVDRRSHGRRCGAQWTLEAFAGRLCTEFDLDALSDEPSSTPRRAVQPAHAGVWRRDPS